MPIFSRLKKYTHFPFFLPFFGRKNRGILFSPPSSLKKDSDADELAKTFSKHVGYTFRQPALLVQALKHRSCLNASAGKRNDSYERLEFLGDAVLNLVATELLFSRFPDQDEGTMTKEKAALVNQRVLAEKARRMKIDQLILLSESEDKIGGRQRTSILADALESVLGAIFLDNGYEASRAVALQWVYPDIDLILRDHQSINYKGMLLEYTQGKHMGMPYYQVIHETGPEHRKQFTVQVLIQKIPYGIGKGFSKKEAEQQAARQTLLKFKLISS